MLFNSFVFIFAFLPITFLVYFGLNRMRHYTTAKIALVVASHHFFYLGQLLGGLANEDGR